MRIEGGTGNGYAAKVTPENRLSTETVTRSAERHANEDEGQAFHVLFSASATAANDCIFYMTNSSDSKNMIVEGIWLYVSGAVEISVKLNAKGTRNSATALTAVNCNGSSGNTADGTFENGVDLDGGSATLTGGSIVSMYKYIAETATHYVNFEQDIVIPRNGTLTLWSNSGTPTITGHVVFNYHEQGD